MFKSSIILYLVNHKFNNLCNQYSSYNLLLNKYKTTLLSSNFIHNSNNLINQTIPINKEYLSHSFHINKMHNLVYNTINIQINNITNNTVKESYSID